MRFACLLGLLAPLLAHAQEVVTPAPPPVSAWDLDPPGTFPACRAQEDAVADAQNREREAEAFAEAPLPLPPIPRGDIVRGAPLFADAELRQPLAVRADAETVTLTAVHVVGGDDVVYVGQYESGGSSFKVYVAPAATSAPTVNEERAKLRLVRRDEAEAAARAVVSARDELRVCTDAATYRWRQEQAQEQSMALTRASGRVVLREGPESYDPAAFELARGELAWVFGMTEDETYFFVRDPETMMAGMATATSFEEPDRVREVLRPIMQAYQEQREAERAAYFEETPDLLITAIEVVGEYGMSGVRITFANLRQGKTIKYIRFSVRPYNAVGDRIPASQWGGTETVRGIGPVPPSADETSVYEWDTVWITDLVACATISAVTVEYMDGTERRWRSVSEVDRIVEFADIWNRCRPRLD